MPGMRTTGGEEMLRTVAAILRGRGTQGWLVGGTVRDRRLGRYSPDLDVAVAGEAAAVAANVAQALGAPWFALSERHGAFRVVVDRAHIDVTAVRGGGILADLALRDFTVNAMAIPLDGGWLIDPFGGLDDLRAGRLAAVSDHIFDDDPLRLMRAPRFAHVLGLRPDARLAGAVRVQAPRLWRAAPERIVAEMVLTLAAGAAGDAARLWNDLGLLRVVVPEAVEDDYPVRTCVLLDRLEEILADLAGRFPVAAPLLEQRLAEPVDGAVSRGVALRFAGLVRALGPAQAHMAGRRMKVSSALLSLLQKTASMSGRAGGLGQSARRAGPGREAVLFLWDAAPWEPEVTLLEAAAEPEGTSLEAPERLMTLWAERAASGVPHLPVDGVGLMEELGLPPGPQLGKALRAAQLVWEAGEATTTEQALSAAREALGEG
jgi:poly(A) polymerase